MLNELADLRRILAEQGVTAEPWHPHVQTLRKGAALIVEVDGEGLPVKMTALPLEQSRELRNIQPDNQSSFPAFNLNVPLFVNGGAENEALRGFRELELLTARAALAWNGKEKKKYIARIGRSFRFASHPHGGLIATGNMASNPVLASTKALLCSLSKVVLDADGFVRSFATAAIRSVESGSLDRVLLDKILFGTLDDSGKPKKWQLLIYLDVAESRTYSHRVADPAAAHAWSEALLSVSPPKAATSTLLCAIAGVQGEPVGQKMPSQNLPEVGPSLLMSMNKDIPAQKRYGQTSTGIFPISKQTALELNNALRLITAPEREGKTWGRVASGTQEKRDLLIVYLERDIKSEMQLATQLGNDDEWEDEAESSDESVQQDSGAEFYSVLSSFESRSKRLIEAIRLKPDLMEDDAFLRVFVISTIDKGRKQVLFDQRYSVSALFRAQERWIAGSRNVPPIAIQLPQGKGKRALLYSGHVPTPVAVLKSLRQQWIRRGQESDRWHLQTLVGVDLRRIYNLLLENSGESETMWLLERLLPLSRVLLMGAGKPAVYQAKNGEICASLNTGAELPSEAKRTLLTVIALCGILLHRLGRYKENYMEGRDYLLGQFLQCADELHLMYCKHVRGGSVPPQLIGNAALPMALENPAKAVEVLCARVPVYVAWLKQKASGTIRHADDGVTKRQFFEMNDDEKSVATAKSISRRLGELSAELKGKLNVPVSLTGRAELLLGYLAREPEKRD